MTEREFTYAEFEAEMAAIRAEFLECGFDPKLPRQNAPTSRLEH